LGDKSEEMETTGQTHLEIHTKDNLLSPLRGWFWAHSDDIMVVNPKKNVHEERSADNSF